MSHDRDTTKRYQTVSTRIRTVQESRSWEEVSGKLVHQGASAELVKLVLAFMVAQGVATSGARAMDKLGIIEDLPALLQDAVNRKIFADVFAQYHPDLAGSAKVLEQTLEASVVFVVANALLRYQWIFPRLSGAEAERWPSAVTVLEKKRSLVGAIATRLTLLGHDLQARRE